ncbi:hypothetical protein ABEB36_000511 [Hypothenemus hampei]
MTWNFIDDYTGDPIVSFQNQTFDLDKLKIDQYYFTVTTDPSKVDLSNIHVYTLHKECIECPYTFLNKSEKDISKTNNMFRLATEQMDYYPQNLMDSVICDLDLNHFQQFGIYNIKVNNLTACDVEVISDPVNPNSPIFTVALIHIVLFTCVYLVLRYWQRWQQQDKAPEAHKKERVKSLDAFRGISIVLMIFANFGSGGYEFIDHTTWNGLHVADLVFPWFMWIMGACIPISLISSFKRNISNKDLMWNVAKRSVKLFLLGIFLNSGCDLYYIRIFGVLQRFGLCYFIVTTILIFTMVREESMINERNSIILKNLVDILKLWKAWLISLLILAVHCIIIFTVTAPGCPKGYMGPGGLHKNRSYINCIGGATGYIDKLLLGHHVYQNPTINEVFESKPFEPEGILGCLTSVLHVMLGVQAGVTLLTFKGHFERILRWLIWGVLLGVIGGALCGFSKEDGLIPLNKNLW